ncbi:MAG: hypothetical protein AAFV25_27710 [Bacteroidota bacterium]
MKKAKMNSKIDQLFPSKRGQISDSQLNSIKGGGDIVIADIIGG